MRYPIGQRVIIKDTKSELNNFEGVIIDTSNGFIFGKILYLVRTSEGIAYFYENELEAINGTQK